MNEEFYISLIGEAFDGYTECKIDNQDTYLKHISIRDQRYLHKYYEKYKKLALDRGLETEADRIAAVTKDEVWTVDDDAKIASLEKEVENLKSTVKAIFLPSQKEAIQKDLKKRRLELTNLVIKRKEVIGKTAEDYAQVRSGDELLRCLLFSDSNLKNYLYSDDQFAELETWEVADIAKIQQDVGEKFSDSVIQQAVLRPFFSMYLSSCENIAQFYGKPVINLTIYQLKVAVYGRMFFNIFQNVPDIPENIKDDPEKLLSFSDAQMNKNKNSGGINHEADSSAVFGATKEDMEALEGNAKTISMSDELKKHGGTLDMQQMMRLAGHDV